MDELFDITRIGLAAAFFIVVVKLILTRYRVPGLSDVFAIV